MIIKVWYAIVRFLQKLFNAPERTALEQELARQVDYLQTELSRAREREHEYYLRLLPNNDRPEPVPAGPISVSQRVITPEARIKELERRSRERMLQTHLEALERKAKADEEAIERQERQEGES